MSLEENLNLLKRIALARHCRGRLDEAQGKWRSFSGWRKEKRKRSPSNRRRKKTLENKAGL